MIGVGAAPFVVGLTSDLLSNQFGEESLRYALMIGSVVVLIASYCFFASAKYFKNPTQSVTE